MITINKTSIDSIEVQPNGIVIVQTTTSNFENGQPVS